MNRQSRSSRYVEQIATEVGAALNVALVDLGDRLGLDRAMADGQPVTAAELAARTETHARDGVVETLKRGARVADVGRRRPRLA